MQKSFISAQELLSKSIDLAHIIFKSGYRPNFIVGIWRGGAPIGICVQETLDYLGIPTDHIAIRTSSYQGMERQNKAIRVHGLRYIEKNINADDQLLIIDDVFDTGLSIQKVIEELKSACRKNMPDIKVATTYFKPKNNKTHRAPDFYVKQTHNWLVFPHELKGLTPEEIEQYRPQIHKIISENICA